MIWWLLRLGAAGAAVSLAAGLILGAASAVDLGGLAPPSVVEFSAGISPAAQPWGIAAGADGNLWFTEISGNRVARITPTGAVTEFSAGIAGASPAGIAAGPDGNLWFAEYNGDRIGRIAPSGSISEFSSGLSGGAGPRGIALGPDGNLWFTELTGNRVGRITPAGVVSEFSAGISAGASPEGIVAGPDGNLWFTEHNADRIGRVTPSGAISEFSIGISAGAGIRRIAAGPDGNLWFTETFRDRIGRITPAGVVSEFSVGISAGASPEGIVAGPDGNLWFTEIGNRIGRITPAGVVSEFSSGITSGAHPWEIVAGPDGNLWFTEIDGNRIGRIATDVAASPSPPTTTDAPPSQPQPAALILKARLTGKYLHTTSPGSGTATITFKGSRICWKFTYRGIDSPRDSGIHQVPPPATGKHKRAVLPFTTRTSTAPGCAAANTTWAKKVKAHPAAYYVIIATVNYPQGAIGGPLQALRHVVPPLPLAPSVPRIGHLVGAGDRSEANEDATWIDPDPDRSCLFGYARGTDHAPN